MNLTDSSDPAALDRLRTALTTIPEADLRAARTPAASSPCYPLLAFSGRQASTGGANNARMALEPAVPPDILVAGLLGLAIGAIGGARPAIAATRLPPTAVLRARGRRANIIPKKTNWSYA